MAEYDIVMQQEQDDGSFNQYYPIAKCFTLMTSQNNIPVVNRKDYRLYGLVLQNYYQQGGNS